MGDDLPALRGDVGGEDGDVRLVGALDGRADALRVRRADDDRVHALDDEVLDLRLLLGEVEVAGVDGQLVALPVGGLAQAGFELTVELVLARQKRHPDALAAALRRPALAARPDGERHEREGQTQCVNF